MEDFALSILNILNYTPNRKLPDPMSKPNETEAALSIWSMTYMISIIFTAIRCPDPEPGLLSNMTVYGVYYSQTVDYICDFGCSVQPPNTTFNSTDIPEPVVNLTITCLANGTWSAHPIHCESE